MNERERKELEALGAQSELAIANKTLTITLTVICSIISAAYLLEVFKQARTIGYVLITILLAMVPPIIDIVLYRGNPESPAILHVSSIGYGLLYTFVLFTAQNALVFTYAIPMIVVIPLFNNKKHTTLLGVAICLENIIDAALQLSRAEDPKTLLATLEIQVLVMIVIICYVIAVSNGNERFEKIRAARLTLQEEKTRELMNDILSVSSHMTGTIEKVSTEVAHLKESVDQTVTSMQEVTGGTGESSQAVQRQLVKTEEIQTHISDVEKVSQIITDNIHTTGNAVSVGQKHITELNRYTVQVDQAGRKVAEVLEMFRQTTSRMNTITDLITNVASETSLLALNASIEAARAGDAGRGFAVVASEISGLASQTTEATDNIVSLIESVSSQVDTMVQTIQELIRTGNEESRCAEETSRSFTTISDNISVIQDHSQQLATVVKNLASANREIVDSIQTISSITEEVNAHASETHDISERNQSIVSDLTGLMNSLNSDAAELKGHT